MNEKLRGQVAVITGAAQGLGRAFARAYAEAGAVSIVTDVNMEKAEAVASEIRGAGGEAEAVRMDVGDEQSVKAAFDQIIKAHGRVDILMNNAAMISALKMKSFDTIPFEEWDKVMRVNMSGVFLCCKEAAPHMKEAGYGRIINVASGAARMGRPGYLHYITSKGAIEAMTRSIARELGPFGITANSLAPGAIFTEIPRDSVNAEQKATIVAAQCVQRPGMPQDLISTALHLASSDISFVSGQTFVVDGGLIHG